MQGIARNKFLAKVGVPLPPVDYTQSLAALCLLQETQQSGRSSKFRVGTDNRINMLRLSFETRPFQTTSIHCPFKKYVSNFDIY
jgi:hypothetical protein